jgi:hypothetical protein
VGVSSSFGPEYAPVGDVGTALLIMDSRLRQIRDDRAEADAEERRLVEQFLRSFDGEAAGEVLDGVCTLIYLFMEWLRKAHEAHDRDVLEHVVPYLVGTMRNMPRSVKPEAIPTMAGMLTAAAIGLSPTLWRKQYGAWNHAEMTALEATVFLLAEHINRLSDDEDAATRMIADVLNTAAGGPDPMRS